MFLTLCSFKVCLFTDGTEDERDILRNSLKEEFKGVRN